MIFQDRSHAGRLLVPLLENYKNKKNTLILGLARGGVVVAFEVAKGLALPLNVVVPRKIGAPGNPELALGAIMENGEGVFNDSILKILGISQKYLNEEIEKEVQKVHERLKIYRKIIPLPNLKDKTVILVDDGIATGATMHAVINMMRKEEVAKIIIAAPVASSEALNQMEKISDEIVCLESQMNFGGVSNYYVFFNQTDDNQVIELLRKATIQKGKESNEKKSMENVKISIGKNYLEGILQLPEDCQGIVLFVHGSGSSRFSPRNQFVANKLLENRLGSLLIDLLSPEEEKIDEVTKEFRFDIELLVERLLQITIWIQNETKTKEFPLGFFGSSTGAAAALIAAAQKGKKISAVVSRGGRPDLASDYLFQIESPTLLIVGENDTGVIELNQMAFESLKCEKKMEIIPKATHLFEEEGALDQVASLASNWFSKHFISQ